MVGIRSGYHVEPSRIFVEYKIDSEETVAGAVVTAVSSSEDCNPGSLPLLHDLVDTDALNGLFASVEDDPTRRNGTVIFEYSESFVTVHNTDKVTVIPLKERPQS